MVRKYVKEKFEYRKIIESSATITDLTFDQCVIEGGAIMQEEANPAYDLVIRDTFLRKCKTGNVELFGIRFEDVTIDTLSHSKPIELEACVCKHVVLRGNLGAVRFSPAIYDDPHKVLASAAAERYKDIDWALDITEARFTDIEIRDVPGHLVKRNPETQFLIHRDAAAAVDINELPKYTQILVERVAEAPMKPAS